jgi:hypothetical protein
LKYKSTEMIESKVCPEVRFTIRKASYARKVAYNRATAQYREERGQIAQEYLEDWNEHSAELKAAAEEKRDYNLPKTLARVQEGAMRLKILDFEKKIPALLDIGFVSIEGIEISGTEAVTLEVLKAEGPDTLLLEIAAAIEHDLGLSEEEQGNSERPITSGAQEDGPTDGSRAQSANESPST